LERFDHFRMEGDTLLGRRVRVNSRSCQYSMARRYCFSHHPFNPSLYISSILSSGSADLSAKFSFHRRNKMNQVN